MHTNTNVSVKILCLHRNEIEIKILARVADLDVETVICILYWY